MQLERMTRCEGVEKGNGQKNKRIIRIVGSNFLSYQKQNQVSDIHLVI